MLERLKKWLHFSPHFHARRDNVHDLLDLVSLIDRFLDDRLRYELEWDDFISWKHENSGIEPVRIRIAALEPLFFSETESDRDRGTELLTTERNNLAAIGGLPARNAPGKVPARAGK